MNEASPRTKSVRAPHLVCDPKQVLKNCRICGSTNLQMAVDLGYQPWCNHFLKKEEIGTEDFFPLRVVFCMDCRTPQLDYTVPKEVMFSKHTYLSGVTRTLSEHFRSVAEEVDKRFFENVKKKSVLDIGSNDGTQLKYFKALGYDVLGVDPAEAPAKMANDAGIPTVNDFFNLALAKKLGRRFDVVNAAGVFFHLEELHSVTDAIKEVLAPDGVFVIQFLYLKGIVEHMAFDQIYHEHLLYYNLKNVEALLNMHGLALFDTYLAPVHGGSMIAFAAHAEKKREPSAALTAFREAEERDKSNEFPTYQRFAEGIKAKKKEVLAYLGDARKKGKRIFGMGAPVKGNTLLNYFGIGPDYIECLVEKNALRRGLYAPGSHIPIVIEDELKEQPDIYYFLAWNFKKEIIANNKFLTEKGIELYFPVDPDQYQ